MIQHVLHIDSSVFGSNGQSAQLGQYLLDKLQSKTSIAVVHRDLNAKPLPHLSGEMLMGMGKEPHERSPEQAVFVQQADEAIAEVQRADLLVLAAPMYNFAIPSTLKTWIDFIARAGVTFRYTENGPEGLLKNKKAIVISSRGGIHKGKASDTQTDFVNTILGFVGITDVEWVYAEGVNMSDHKEDAIASAKAEIDNIVEGL